MFTSQNITDKLSSATNKALDIFNKTLTELSRINIVAQEQINSNVDKIDELTKENNNLETILTKNNSTIDKIKLIIE